MKGQVTQGLEFARTLISAYRDRGPVHLMDILRQAAQVMADQSQHSDPNTLDAWLLTVASSLVTVLEGNDEKMRVRRQVELCAGIAGAESPDEKTEALLHGIRGFIEAYEENRQATTFSTDVLLALSSVPLEDMKRLSVSWLADHLKMNASSLSARFKAEQGFSLSDAIRDEKLNRAFFLLKDFPEMRIQEVARMVGFSQRNYFSESFREKFGVPPSKIS